MTTYERLVLKEELSADLALRDLAKKIFDEINSSDSAEISVDFNGIRSISRSFAQEYLNQKKVSPKTIIEENIPENVKKMFWATTETEGKNPIIRPEELKVFCI